MVFYDKSQIYDSVRIKPIDDNDPELLEETCRRKVEQESRFVKRSPFYDEKQEIPQSLIRALIKSYERKLSIEDYKALGVKEPKSTFYGYKPSEWKKWHSAFWDELHKLRRSFNSNFRGLQISGDLLDLAKLYQEINSFLNTYGEDAPHFLLSFVHKALKDTIIREIRKEFPTNLTQKEIGGILSKSRTWRQQLGIHESEFGKYEGDIIIPKSRSVLIVHNHWARRKKLSLLFQWQLQAVHELAISQKLIVPYYIKQLTSFDQNERKSYVGNTEIQFLSGLTNIYIHLSPHLRKWYYLLSNAMGVKKTLETFAIEMDKYLQGYLKSPNNLRHVQYIINLQESIVDYMQIGDNTSLPVERGELVMEHKKHFSVDNKGATIGQQQIGNYNRMEQFQNFVDSQPINYDQAKSLREKILELQKAIEGSGLEDYAKEDAIQDLQKIVGELQKPSDMQDKSKLSHYWTRTVSLVKEVSALAGFVKIVGELLKLSV
jgi:hypothetical protein